MNCIEPQVDLGDWDIDLNYVLGILSDARPGLCGDQGLNDAKKRVRRLFAALNRMSEAQVTPPSDAEFPDEIYLYIPRVDHPELKSLLWTRDKTKGHVTYRRLSSWESIDVIDGHFRDIGSAIVSARETLRNMAKPECRRKLPPLGSRAQTDGWRLSEALESLSKLAKAVISRTEGERPA